MPDTQSTALARYRGVNRCGVGVTGAVHLTDSPAAFVERKFRARWQALTVTRDGQTLGSIEQSVEDPARRTWWAEL